MANVVLCIIACCLLAQPQQRAPESHQAATDNAQAALASKNNQESAADANTAKASSPHWYASSEWWLVLIALGTALAIVYQAREMRQATDVMRKQSEVLVASERAWLTVGMSFAPGYEGVFSGTHATVDSKQFVNNATIRISYKNDGKTPAWITDRRCCMRVFDPVPNEPPLDECQVIEYDTVSLAAGEEKTFDTPIQGEGERTMDNVGIIYGSITYRTAVGIIGTTLFAYRISIGGKKLLRFSFPEWDKNM